MMCAYRFFWFLFFKVILFLLHSSAAEPVAHIRNSGYLVAQVLPRVSPSEHASDEQHGLEAPLDRQLFAVSNKGQSQTRLHRCLRHRDGFASQISISASFRTPTHTLERSALTPKQKGVCFSLPFQVSESGVKPALQHSSEKTSDVEDPRLHRQK